MRFLLILAHSIRLIKTNSLYSVQILYRSTMGIQTWPSARSVFAHSYIVPIYRHPVCKFLYGPVYGQLALSFI